MSTVKRANHAKLHALGYPGLDVTGSVLRKLGSDLALARRRRHITQASLAERMQTSVATIRRMEKGDSGVSIGSIAQALFVFGELEKLGTLLDTANDEIGLMLMNEQVPKRVRHKNKKPTGAL